MKASELEFTYLLIKETDKKNNEQNLIVIQKKNAGVLLLMFYTHFLTLIMLETMFYPFLKQISWQSSIGICVIGVVSMENGRNLHFELATQDKWR